MLNESATHRVSLKAVVTSLRLAPQSIVSVPNAVLLPVALDLARGAVPGAAFGGLGRTLAQLGEEVGGRVESHRREAGLDPPFDQVVDRRLFGAGEVGDGRRGAEFAFEPRRFVGDVAQPRVEQLRL